MIRISSTRRTGAHRLVSGPSVPFIGLPNDGDGGGGCVCFVCGKSTGCGEPIVVVSRLWQLTEGNASLKAVIDATSALQVCIPCTLRAAVQKIEFAHVPKLVSLELAGFYYYAGTLARGYAISPSDTKIGDTWPVSDLLALKQHDAAALPCSDVCCSGSFSDCDENQCYSCGEGIAIGSRHMLIEIAVHTVIDSKVHLSGIWPVTKYCNACSHHLFPVDDNDRLDPSVW